MKAWILGMALLVGMATSATSLGSIVAADSGNKVLFVGEDLEGNLVVKEVELDHNGACGGFVPHPGPDECSTGEHVRLGGVSHGFALFPRCGQHLGANLPSIAGRCYAGLATSRLVASSGMRTFICDIQYYPGVPAALQLNQVSCAGSGTFPLLNESFTHVCFSDDTGTNGAGDSGTGLGDWGCNISHT